MRSFHHLRNRPRSSPLRVACGAMALAFLSPAWAQASAPSKNGLPAKGKTAYVCREGNTLKPVSGAGIATCKALYVMQSDGSLKAAAHPPAR